MDTKRALEVEGRPLLKCEPPPKRDVFESFFNFLKKKFFSPCIRIRTHFLSKVGPGICDSCVKRIHLSQIAMICIQRKHSTIAGHALSKLKVAFFFRYNDSSFTFEC